MAARRLDGGVIVALVWAIVAVAMTALIGPQLGLRGWLWLGLHHALCLAGVTHELRRGYQRHRDRLAARQRPPMETTP
ncbi:MAG: hypothetical protein VX899_06955 [Myxococcota bacterium]|nr:hypothetical protein [Myxococcota bacterium]